MLVLKRNGYYIVRFYIFFFIIFTSLQLPSKSTALEGYNMAPSGTASQNTTGFNGVASRANDGNTDGIYRNRSVQHSSRVAVGNWWQVDLGEIKHIETINTWNRTDCCVSRARDFHVFVSDTPFSGTSIASSQNQTGVSEYHFAGIMGRPTSFTINRTGRYVRLQIASRNYMNVAEVEVIGDDLEPAISVVKTADISSGASVGQTITYEYVVTNSGTVPLTNVVLSDIHRGTGAPPIPKSETLLEDNRYSGDSIDLTPDDGTWDVLGPKDVIVLHGTYIVQQEDIDTLQ